MTKTLKILYFFFSMALIGAPAVADDYVAVDPSAIETVSGKTLMAASYAIVLGMLALYWVYMMIKSRKLKLHQDNLKHTNIQ